MTVAINHESGSRVTDNAIITRIRVKRSKTTGNVVSLDLISHEMKTKAFSLWLDCFDIDTVCDRLEGSCDRASLYKFLLEKTSEQSLENLDTIPGASDDKPYGVIQHNNIWNFPANQTNEREYFGKMPIPVVQNLLYYYTRPGQVVFDPFAGSGTTIEVSKSMSRRVWSSDVEPSTPDLPIRVHDITSGYPTDAPSLVDLVLLDPPYFRQARNKYPKHEYQIGNARTYRQFNVSMTAVIHHCYRHIKPGGYLAFIISPTVKKWDMIDHAYDFSNICSDVGLQLRDRVIVPYPHTQFGGFHVNSARNARRMLYQHRDLVVFQKI